MRVPDPPDRQRPDPADEPGIGPLSEDIVRPARTLTLLQTGAMALLAVLTVAVAVALAPRMLAGVGLLGRTMATVVSTGSDGSPGDAVADGSGQAADEADGADASGEFTCRARDLTVQWGADQRGVVTWCEQGTAPMPTPGDTVPIWTLPGWDPVPATGRGSDTVLAAVVLAILVATAFGAVVYGRQWQAVVRLRRRRLAGRVMPATVDRLLFQRGLFKNQGRARIRVTFADAAALPLYLTLPQGVDRSILGAVVEVRPAGRTLRGRDRGPYVVTRIAGDDRPSGMLVALGRAYRADHGT